MRWNRFFILALAAITVLGFAAQMYHVFMLRFDMGDVFPAYSTHRSDPLGGRALYEALSHFPGLEVSRNTENLNKLTQGADTTLVLAGASDSADSKASLENIERFVISGGRLVIAFGLLPETPVRESDDQAEIERERQTDSDDAGKEGEEEEASGRTSSSRQRCRNGRCGVESLSDDYENIRERWGFQLGEIPLPNAKENSTGRIKVTRRVASPEIPEDLWWRSPYYFDTLAKHWRVCYGRETLRDKPNTALGHFADNLERLVRKIIGKPRPVSETIQRPVVIERRWGDGSIVLLSDSYLLSNEAMRWDRYPAFLTWLIGPHHRILFDETHLGVMESPGVMTLIRRYRMHWILVALGIVAALFIWRNALSLTPRHREDRASIIELGRQDASEGLVNLLRRSVPPKELNARCFDLWVQDLGRTSSLRRDNIEKARNLAQNPDGHSAIECYRDISKLLNERKP